MTNDSATTAADSKSSPPAWKKIVAKYQKAAVWPGVWQLCNTLIPYAALWCVIYFALKVSWWLTIPLARLAAGFLVRAFIISHDCGHGSFLPSKKANEIVGFITGVLTFTPFHQWRWEHSIHHSTSGDLGPQSLHSFRPCASLHLHHQTPDSVHRGRTARTSFGLVDQSGDRQHCGSHEHGFWAEGILAVASIDGAHRRFGRYLVILCSASI
jgi:fatty acid desaturase